MIILNHSMTMTSSEIKNLYGNTWEWTSSHYLPYECYKPWDKHLGEYNSKFMFNQLVLKGGSCLTPISHIRASYRNFFTLLIDGFVIVLD